MTLTPIPTSTSFAASFLESVPWWRFQAFFELARINDERTRANTGPFNPAADARYWLTADDMSGFAISADGELKYVFSRVGGRGYDLIQAAVDRGATHLNCFAPLAGIYALHGFEVTRTEANWYPDGPDVAYMVRP